MLIVCPNCQTHYSVDRQGFEPGGRVVRCSNCGSSWRQGPVAESPTGGWTPQPQAAPQPAAYPPPPPPGYPPYPPPGYPPYSPYPPPGYSPPPPPDYPPHAAGGEEAPAPAAVAPAPPPEVDNSGKDIDVVEPDFDLPDPEEEEDLDDGMAANIDALFDGEDEDAGEDEGVAEAEGESEAEPAVADEIGDNDLSEDEIDGLFDDDADTGVASMVDSGGGDDGIDDLDDIPEPEPLPESLTGAIDDGEDDDDDHDMPPTRRGAARRKKNKSGGKGALIAGVIVVLLLSAIAAGGYLARATIVGLVPATKTVYDMVGIDTGILGDGLEIRDVQSSRSTQGGIDILVASGTIANVDDALQPVPLVQALLFDGGGEIIQTVVQEPGQAELAPGGAFEFQIKIEEPSPLSRRLEVSFAPRPKAGDGE